MGMILSCDFLWKPVREKISSDQSNGKLSYGASSMQGWRVEQEDEHNCILDFDTNSALFAVYDGHGGPEVSEYCANKLPEFLKALDSYKSGDIEKALVEAFLGFDAFIITPEVIAELIIASSKSKERVRRRMKKDDKEKWSARADRRKKEKIEAEAPRGKVNGEPASDAEETEIKLQSDEKNAEITEKNGNAETGKQNGEVDHSDDDNNSGDSGPDRSCDDTPLKCKPGYRSGCTAVVALLVGNELYVANAGDSRCIVSRDGRAEEMSFDHKPMDNPEYNRVRKAGGQVREGRVQGDLNLSRAIGDHRYKLNSSLSDREQMITALPDIKRLTIEPGRDEFMVVACDGIWNSMSNDNVVQFVRNRLQAEDRPKNLSQICEEMFDHCLAEDTLGDIAGCDNMTCIIVEFKPAQPNATSVPVGAAPKRDSSPIAKESSKRSKTESSIIYS